MGSPCHLILTISYFRRLGLTISYQKSFLSATGCAEFAKRFRVRNLSKNFSLISVKSLLNCYHLFGAMSIYLRYPNKGRNPLDTISKVDGYRVLSRLDHSRSAHVNRLLAMWTKTTLVRSIK